MTTILVWFRRDLRLEDNSALTYSLAQANRVVPVYIHAPQEEAPWAPGGAARWWLHHSLKSLDKTLHNCGSRLIVRRGNALTELFELINECGAQGVFWNRLYEPKAVVRDSLIKQSLREQGLMAESFNAALLFEPWTIKNQHDEPYRVFTPFWRRCTMHLPELPIPNPAPVTIPSFPKILPSLAVEELKLLPRVRWDQGIAATWRAGKKDAHGALEQFCRNALLNYSENRNFPGQFSTSRLSPYLHFGELGPRQILAAIHEISSGDPHAGLTRSTDTFVRELGWREFAHHLLYYFPHTAATPLDQRFSDYPWSGDKVLFEAWSKGQTGYPIVDACMRELWRTGWMHNRVRMIVGSFLTKNLGVNWLEGARWFWDTLVDADLANNTLGWQWTAGCGADAAPYYRIFNPVLQAERFDPDRAYIRHWLPEIARLPDKYIHRPWTTPKEILKASGVTLGIHYPLPVVDYYGSRAQALAGYDRIKQS